MRAQQEVLAKQRAGGAAPEPAAAPAPEPRAATAPARAPRCGSRRTRPRPHRAPRSGRREARAAGRRCNGHVRARSHPARRRSRRGRATSTSTAASAVQLRVAGKLVAIGGRAARRGRRRARAARRRSRERERAVFAEHGDLDFCHEVAGRRPLPRQPLPPAARPRRRLPLHPARAAEPRAARPAVGARALHHLSPGAGARHRSDRLRQDVDARRARRPDQRGAPRAHPHDRGSRRVPAPLEALPGEPAQRAPTHRTPSRARCARRCARIRT